MKRNLIIFSAALFLIFSCKSGNKPAGQAEDIKQFELTEVWRTDTVLLTPESVVYDKTRDVLFVSDMNMEPRVKDGNGFISKLGTDGKIIELRWVEGLSSPKGLAVVGDTLYAADIDALFVIDINNGRIVRTVTIEGIKMLIDVTAAPDGSLYVVDSDANKLYHYSNGKMTEWLTEGINGPNGLLFDGNRLLLASMGSNDFSTIDLSTKTVTMVTDSINHADGIAYTGIAGYYLVSEWGGQIYMINPDYSKVSLLNTMKDEINSADIDFIPGQNLLLVPTFFKNSIVAYKLTEK
jgi:DNA-binding beta-propeller fold protein YncE